jgi:hypothetical protein
MRAYHEYSNANIVHSLFLQVQACLGIFQDPTSKIMVFMYMYVWLWGKWDAQLV